MVVVEGLIKKFGNHCAVDNISFEARPGEILGFLGPNGAGKSTTMKMITSYLPPDQGTISICGINTSESTLDSRQKIGYLPENNPLYKDMYILEFLNFAANIHKLQNAKTRIDNIIEMTGLSKEKHKIINALSKGYRQRVGLAQALLHDPEVLILDEPTSGLDMNQLIDIRALIKDLGKTKTIIFSTHIMQEVQALCDRVIIINEGKIVANDAIEELHHRIKGETVITMKFKNELSDTSPIESITGVLRVIKSKESLKIYVSEGIEIRDELFYLSAKNNWPIHELSAEKQSVEYIFQKLTKDNIS